MEEAMSNYEVSLREIAFTSKIKPKAMLNFKPGVNVICGASDTGKSFLIEVIDFILGGSDPLRDIPERIDYDQINIVIIERNNSTYTLGRNVDGGGFKLYNGYIFDENFKNEPKILKEKHSHGKNDSLSGWLLEKIGLFDRRIRKNKQGETKSLSFRDLARLVIVDEKEIIRSTSPFFSGQFITKTAEYSTLKLLLTGIDDSSLVPSGDAIRRNVGIVAKLELIEQWIVDLRNQIEDIGIDKDELLEQSEKLNNAIANRKQYMFNSQTTLNKSLETRRETLNAINQVTGRMNEIKDLLKRFDLLKQHYSIDIERLIGIEESGSLFVYQKRVPCPLCGALVEDEHKHGKCDGDINSIIAAAISEKFKIKRFLSDLKDTINELSNENINLSDSLSKIEDTYNAIDKEAQEKLLPDFQSMQSEYTNLIEKKSDLASKFVLFERLEKLEYQRNELTETDDEDAPEIIVTSLSKVILNNFSKTIERILKAWNFPNANDIYFDEKSKDFVIAGKPRGSRGKGLRAITHAAITIGLMEYCQENRLPHPGFVVLDSPLLAYYKPEGADDSLQGTDLKEKFYEYLTTNHFDNQVIIIENEHPPHEFDSLINLTIFTKNPRIGRFGLFPLQIS
jgi:predicted nuclease with TOPRIM domain